LAQVARQRALSSGKKGFFSSEKKSVTRKGKGEGRPGHDYLGEKGAPFPLQKGEAYAPIKKKAPWKGREKEPENQEKTIVGGKLLCEKDSIREGGEKNVAIQLIETYQERGRGTQPGKGKVTIKSRLRKKKAHEHEFYQSISSSYFALPKRGRRKKKCEPPSVAKGLKKNRDIPSRSVGKEKESTPSIGREKGGQRRPDLAGMKRKNGCVPRAATAAPKGIKKGGKDEILVLKRQPITPTVKREKGEGLPDLGRTLETRRDSREGLDFSLLKRNPGSDGEKRAWELGGGAERSGRGGRAPHQKDSRRASFKCRKKARRHCRSDLGTDGQRSRSRRGKGPNEKNPESWKRREDDDSQQESGKKSPDLGPGEKELD